ncbi:glycerophosphodiester phosphodiesterase [Flavisolibacter ginsenosidimutans]|nr:glycerophosphodiester phosphodiesterase family protein [Flavisolibacter ginsenosidimutans]
MAKPKGLYVLLGALLTVVGAAAYVAYRTRSVPTPRRRWWRFHRPGARRLRGNACERMQGIYSIEKGTEIFGDTAVVKCSYTIEHRRKNFHLSFFCQKNGTYFVCEAKVRRGAVLLYGYWRKASSNGTGLVHLVMSKTAGATALLQGGTTQTMLLQGRFGNDNKRPHQPLLLRYKHALPPNDSFEIIGHRGAARNVDFLPVSENSLAMMKMAARLGATGVEIDVRMTKDGVPVIFHDSFLSVHTVKDKIYGGLIHNYTLRELKRMRLRKGGVMPTLDECLHTLLHKTPLQTVWLDIKKECNLEIVQQLQERYLQRATALGRKFFIYIGIPDNDVLKCFVQLKGYEEIPSLVEMNPEVVMNVNANVWAPQYTGGFQPENVAVMHSAGKKAFVWSLDSQFLIDLYMSEGGFDGLVTNAPSVAAHWYYVLASRFGFSGNETKAIAVQG